MTQVRFRGSAAAGPGRYLLPSPVDWLPGSRRWWCCTVSPDPRRLSCFPRQRSTRDGAPVVSLGASVLIFPADTHTRFTRWAASARKSTGNRTSMPRSVRLPWTSSGQTARAATRQSSGSSSWQLTSMLRSATRGTPPRPDTVPGQTPRSAGPRPPPPG